MDRIEEIEEKDPKDWLNNPTCENMQQFGYRPSFDLKPAVIYICCKKCHKSMTRECGTEPMKLLYDDPILQPLIKELSEDWHKDHVKSNDPILKYLGFTK